MIIEQVGNDMEPLVVKWNQIKNATGPKPKPRHGHRAVAIKDLIIIFGGGNEGIIDELHVYHTLKRQWYVPETIGDAPSGTAAFGMVVDDTKIYIFGGMMECQKYSGDLYELDITIWKWKRLKPRPPKQNLPPSPRIGHSFTLIDNQIYLFGGLENISKNPKEHIPRFLNDFYTLTLRGNKNGVWDIPQTYGMPPSPRESHTAVSYVDKELRKSLLIIYGGMNGSRLGDISFLDCRTLHWFKPVVNGIPPLRRSLHSATVISTRMFLLGGWVPTSSMGKSDKDWKCSNTLACFNIQTSTWEEVSTDVNTGKNPRARAGHSAVGMRSRIYVWSGRDGYHKAQGRQVCFDDMWFLEVGKPSAPGRVLLARACSNYLDVSWSGLPDVEYYHLQIQKFIPPPTVTISGTSMPVGSLSTSVANNSQGVTACSANPLLSHSPIRPNIESNSSFNHQDIEKSSTSQVPSSIPVHISSASSHVSLVSPNILASCTYPIPSKQTITPTFEAVAFNSQNFVPPKSPLKISQGIRLLPPSTIVNPVIISTMQTSVPPPSQPQITRQLSAQLNSPHLERQLPPSCTLQTVGQTASSTLQTVGQTASCTFQTVGQTEAQSQSQMATGSDTESLVMNARISPKKIPKIYIQRTTGNTKSRLIMKILKPQNVIATIKAQETNNPISHLSFIPNTGGIVTEDMKDWNTMSVNKITGSSSIEEENSSGMIESIGGTSNVKGSTPRQKPKIRVLTSQSGQITFQNMGRVQTTVNTLPSGVNTFPSQIAKPRGGKIFLMPVTENSSGKTTTFKLHTVAQQKTESLENLVLQNVGEDQTRNLSIPNMKNTTEIQHQQETENSTDMTE